MREAKNRQTPSINHKGKGVLPTLVKFPFVIFGLFYNKKNEKEVTNYGIKKKV